MEILMGRKMGKCGYSLTIKNVTNCYVCLVGVTNCYVLVQKFNTFY